MHEQNNASQPLMCMRCNLIIQQANNNNNHLESLIV